MRRLKSEQGFALLTVVILLVFWGGVLMAFVTMGQQRNLVQRNIQQIDLAENLKDQIHNILRDPVACEGVFANYDHSTKDDPSHIPVTEVKAKTGGGARRVFEVNKAYNYSNVLGLDTTATGSTTVDVGLLYIDRFEVINFNNPPGKAELVMNFRKMAPVLGLPETQRSIRLSVNISGSRIFKCVVDETQSVEKACEMFGGTLEGDICKDLNILGDLTVMGDINAGNLNANRLRGEQGLVAGSLQTGSLRATTISADNIDSDSMGADVIEAGGTLSVGGFNGTQLCRNCCTTTPPIVCGCNCDCIDQGAWQSVQCGGADMFVTQYGHGVTSGGCRKKVVINP